MRFLAVVLFVAALLAPQMAFAQQKCEGPQELCDQVVKLKSELDAQKRISVDAKTGEDKGEKQVTALENKQRTQEERTVKFVSIMGTLAIALKIFLSLLAAWKDTLFKSDYGRAWMRAIVLIITLGVFFTTNLGFGIPWWQAMILAAGGPLSMFIHEMMKLVPVLRGKGKLPPDA